MAARTLLRLQSCAASQACGSKAHLFESESHGPSHALYRIVGKPHHFRRRQSRFTKFRARNLLTGDREAQAVKGAMLPVKHYG